MYVKFFLKIVNALIKKIINGEKNSNKFYHISNLHGFQLGLKGYRYFMNLAKIRISIEPIVINKFLDKKSISTKNFELNVLGYKI